jgi:hypothetical protein
MTRVAKGLSAQAKATVASAAIAAALWLRVLEKLKRTTSSLTTLWQTGLFV